MKIKTTLRFPLMPFRVAKIKKTAGNTTGKDQLLTVGRLKIGGELLEGSIDLLYDLAIPLLSRCLNDLTLYIHSFSHVLSSSPLCPTCLPPPR